jgi:hypothetical protein
LENGSVLTRSPYKGRAYRILKKGLLAEGGTGGGTIV